MTNIETTITETPIDPSVDFIVRGDNSFNSRSETYVIYIDRDSYQLNPDRYITGIAKTIYDHSDQGNLLMARAYHFEDSEDTGRQVLFGSKDNDTMSTHGAYPIERFANRLDDLSSSAHMHKQKYDAAKNKIINQSSGLEKLTKITSLWGGGLSGGIAGLPLGMYTVNRINQTPILDGMETMRITAELLTSLTIPTITGLVGAAIGYFGSRFGWNKRFRSQYPLAKDCKAIRKLSTVAIGGDARRFAEDYRAMIDRSIQGDN